MSTSTLARTPICCSQCGRQGHNKRNRNCPVNVEVRERSERTQEEMRVAMRELRNAESMNNMLTQLLERWQGVVSLEQCLNAGFLFIEVACRSFRVARRHYHAASLLASIGENVRKINRLLMIHQEPNPLAVYSLGTILLLQAEGSEGPQPVYRAVYQLSPVGARVPLGNVPFSEEHVRELIRPRHVAKYSSEYWKDLTITTSSIDLTNEEDPNTKTHDCPVCFETVSSKNVVHTNCRHGYCCDCVKNLASSMKDNTQQPTCPMCRTALTGLSMENEEICTEIKNHLHAL